MSILKTASRVFVAPFAMSCAVLGAGDVSHAESMQNKASDAADEISDGAKSTKRSVQDKFCAKGDAACAAERAEHKLQNATDKAKTKIKEKVHQNE